MKTEDKKEKPSIADEKKRENEFNKWKEMIAFDTKPFKDYPNFQELLKLVECHYVHFGEFGFETDGEIKKSFKPWYHGVKVALEECKKRTYGRSEGEDPDKLNTDQFGK